MAFTLSPTQFRPPLPSSSSSSTSTLIPKTIKLHKNPFTLSCTYSEPPPPVTSLTNSDSDLIYGEKNTIESNSYLTSSSDNGGLLPPPVLKKRKRYRKEYPGESVGITEEMRFVAMKMRNNKGSSRRRPSGESEPLDEEEEDKMVGGDEAGSWEPGMEGFVKYLVDSKLVFDTIERVVEVSNDVSYAYFRRTGLERSESLSRDLEWFSQQNMLIPEPSCPGISYASYLKELSGKSAPLFLSHFYNIYFSHIAGGQVIAKQVAEKLLSDRELNFCKWDKDAEVLLKDVREKLNRLSEHWSRDDKNKCLKEATKSFRFIGQVVRLIIL